MQWQLLSESPNVRNGNKMQNMCGLYVREPISFKARSLSCLWLGLVIPHHQLAASYEA